MTRMRARSWRQTLGFSRPGASSPTCRTSPSAARSADSPSGQAQCVSWPCSSVSPSVSPGPSGPGSASYRAAAKLSPASSRPAWSPSGGARSGKPPLRERRGNPPGILGPRSQQRTSKGKRILRTGPRLGPPRSQGCHGGHMGQSGRQGGPPVRPAARRALLGRRQGSPLVHVHGPMPHLSVHDCGGPGVEAGQIPQGLRGAVADQGLGLSPPGGCHRPPLRGCRGAPPPGCHPGRPLGHCWAAC